MRRKSVIAVISILMMSSLHQQALAQCNWSTKVILADHTNAQLGLTATGDRLILTWAGSGDGGFNSMISFDGVNWGYKVIRLDFPRIALGHNGEDSTPRPSGGLGMTYSPACGYVYAGWRDNSNKMWATRSVDGVNWEAARLIINPFAPASSTEALPNLPCLDCCPECPPPPPPPPPGGVRGTALSAPALRGDNGSLPIGFAFSTYSPTGSSRFEPLKGKFNCDFSNIVFPIQPNFFNQPISPDDRQAKPSTPLWTGAAGIEISSFAQGPQTIQSIVEYILFQVFPGNERFPEKLFVAPTANAWSNNGVAGIVNPNNGIPYVVWNCHPDVGDTCKPESTGKINIYKIEEPFFNRGTHRGCADWSVYNPAVTFFQGRIWIAWRGRESGQTGYINIASLDPF